MLVNIRTEFLGCFAVYMWLICLCLPTGVQISVNVYIDCGTVYCGFLPSCQLW